MIGTPSGWEIIAAWAWTGAETQKDRRFAVDCIKATFGRKDIRWGLDGIDKYTDYREVAP